MKIFAEPIYKAVYVKDIEVNGIELTVFEDKSSGGLFAIDSSYLEHEGWDGLKVASPFNDNTKLTLTYQ